MDNFSTQKPIGSKTISIIYFATLIYTLLYLVSIYILGLFPGLVNPTILLLALAIFFPFSQLSIYAVIVTVLLLAITGYGLWSIKQWGQTLAITLSSINLIFNLINIFIFHTGKSWYTYTTMVFSLIFVAYLLFSTAKNSFKANSKITNVVASLIAIIACLAVGIPKFNEQRFIKINNQNQQNLIATKPIGTDCQVNKSGNNDKAVLTEFDKNGIYKNDSYNFQINFPFEYTIFEGRNYKNCIDEFYISSKVNDYSQTVVNLSIEPSKGDYNVYFDNLRSTYPNIQKTDAAVAGLPGVKLISESSLGSVTSRMIWYVVQNKGYIYSIAKYGNISDDQFDAIADSFKFLN